MANHIFQTTGTTTVAINAVATPTIVAADDLFQPVPGLTITWTVKTTPLYSTRYSIASATSITNASGLATAAFTLGNIPGSYVITASSVGTTPPSVDITCTATAPTSTDIISLADAKAYMGMTDTVTARDNLISGWCTEASRQIEAFIDQPVVPRLVTDILTGRGTNSLQMRTGRILSVYNSPDRISNVQYRNAATDAWSNIATDDAQIFWDYVDPWTLYLLDWLYFPIGLWMNIRVSYYAGFDQVPGDFTEVAVQMVQTMWQQSMAGGNPRLGLGAVSQGMQGGSFNHSIVDMDPRWEKMLQKYRRLV